MPMLERFRRKLSRTTSVPTVQKEVLPDPPATLPLSPSDEQLIHRLTFSEETNLESRPPRRLNPSIDSYVSTLSTTTSERTTFNNVETGFLALPTEVLLTLQRYICPSSEVALRHACSRFYLLYSMPSFYLSGEDKFDFLCMRERDSDPLQLSRLVCGLCRELHPKSAFPSAEIKCEPLDRDCRQVWLCAHKTLGYRRTIKLMKAGVEAPFRSEYLEPCSRCRDTIRNRSIADRPDKGTSAADLDCERSASLLISKVVLLQAPCPSYNERSTSGSGVYKEVFQVKDVVAAMQGLDLPICSHLRMSDPYLLSRFCRACINTQRLPEGVRGPPCISNGKREFGDDNYFFGKCRQTCFTRGCRTKFMFQARESLAPDASGRRQVWLILAIYRWLGPLQNAGSDANWRAHTTTHATRMEMRQKWEKLEKAQRNGLWFASSLMVAMRATRNGGNAPSGASIDIISPRAMHPVPLPENGSM